MLPQLASCLIMHSPFRHTALPLHKATTWQMIGRCPFR